MSKPFADLRPTLPSVLACAGRLWRHHALRLFLLVLPFLGGAALLDLLMRHGLHGTVVEREDFSPASFLRPDLPWEGVRIVGDPYYPGPVGPMAGVWGIVAGALLFVGLLATLRALSLGFHAHGAPFAESVRTAGRAVGPAILALLRQATYVLGWPLLAFLLWFFGGEAVNYLLGEGTIRHALDAGAPVLSRVGLGLIALFALYRVMRSMFTLPALVDQGLTSREALEESLRLTEHANVYSILAFVVSCVVSYVLGWVAMAAGGAAVGSFGTTPEASTIGLALVLAVLGALLTPLARSVWYVFYRSFLVLKGGARR